MKVNVLAPVIGVADKMGCHADAPRQPRHDLRDDLDPAFAFVANGVDRFDLLARQVMHDIDLMTTSVAEIAGADIRVITPRARYGLPPAFADKDVHLAERSVELGVLSQFAPRG